VIGPAILVVAIAAAYVRGVRRAAAWPTARTWSFLAGVFTLAVALLAPLESSLSAHMAQHLLLGLVAPLLLAAGAPVRLALAASPRRRWVRVSSSPTCSCFRP
jgi:cytochrome c oxidase assembly factor CtaG